MAECQEDRTADDLGCVLHPCNKKGRLNLANGKLVLVVVILCRARAKSLLEVAASCLSRTKGRNRQRSW